MAPAEAEDLDQDAPEFESIEAFAEELAADERKTYTWMELRALNRRLRLSVDVIRPALAKKGFTLMERERVHAIRTIGDNPHNRWAGNPCAGGGGGDSLIGIAGYAG